ncbi:hypothetical protein DFP72DRAFT_1051795 [Ephemerocybe angulata]|uniref:Uncharacterized protein n=1 Tax=Ephemerocybe angulata TaxID=980116 RepID=A0A8H6HCR0_9AGAR|nr:hypothetical protein DFP72DRAFT_1051795 [Tulosesus angulatus]
MTSPSRLPGTVALTLTLTLIIVALNLPARNDWGHTSEDAGHRHALGLWLAAARAPSPAPMPTPTPSIVDPHPVRHAWTLSSMDRATDVGLPIEEVYRGQRDCVQSRLGALFAILANMFLPPDRQSTGSAPPCDRDDIAEAALGGEGLDVGANDNGSRRSTTAFVYQLCSYKSICAAALSNACLLGARCSSRDTLNCVTERVPTLGLSVCLPLSAYYTILFVSTNGFFPRARSDSVLFLKFDLQGELWGKEDGWMFRVYGGCWGRFRRFRYRDDRDEVHRSTPQFLVASIVNAYITKRMQSNILTATEDLNQIPPSAYIQPSTTRMHFPALHFLSIVASLAVLSRAYSDDVFEARDNVYIDELSSRTDAALSSLSTRELIAELSERLDRRKQDNNYKEKCTLCGCTRPNTDDCPKTKYGYHNWRKYCDRGWASCTKRGSRKEEVGKREEKRARKRERYATGTSRAARYEARSPSPEKAGLVMHPTGDVQIRRSQIFSPCWYLEATYSLAYIRSRYLEQLLSASTFHFFKIDPHFGLAPGDIEDARPIRKEAARGRTPRWTFERPQEGLWQDVGILALDIHFESVKNVRARCYSMELHRYSQVTQSACNDCHHHSEDWPVRLFVNSSTCVGTLIMEVVERIRKKGDITVKQARRMRMGLGSRRMCSGDGFTSSYFVTDVKFPTVKFAKVILLAEWKISLLQGIVPALVVAAQYHMSLLSILEEPTILTRGHVFTDGLEVKLEKATDDMTRPLVADPTCSDYDRSKLQGRLAKLSGGIIMVGGASEVEVGETKDRYDDALNATRAAAVEEGIMPGGGLALLRATFQWLRRVRGMRELGAVAIIRRAITNPARTIYKNAGEESSVLLVSEYGVEGKPNWGYDAGKGGAFTLSYFVADVKAPKVEFGKLLIPGSETKISLPQDIFPVLEAPAQSPSPLNIVTDDVDGTDNRKSIHSSSPTWISILMDKRDNHPQLRGKEQRSMPSTIVLSCEGKKDGSDPGKISRNLSRSPVAESGGGEEGEWATTSLRNAPARLVKDATPIPTAKFDQEHDGVAITRRPITNPLGRCTRTQRKRAAALSGAF